MIEQHVKQLVDHESRNLLLVQGFDELWIVEHLVATDAGGRHVGRNPAGLLRQTFDGVKPFHRTRGGRKEVVVVADDVGCVLQQVFGFHVLFLFVLTYVSFPVLLCGTEAVHSLVR